MPNKIEADDSISMAIDVIESEDEEAWFFKKSVRRKITIDQKKPEGTRRRGGAPGGDGGAGAKNFEIVVGERVTRRRKRKQAREIHSSGKQSPETGEGGGGGSCGRDGKSNTVGGKKGARTVCVTGIGIATGIEVYTTTFGGAGTSSCAE